MERIKYILFQCSSGLRVWIECWDQFNGPTLLGSKFFINMEWICFWTYTTNLKNFYIVNTTGILELVTSKNCYEFWLFFLYSVVYTTIKVPDMLCNVRTYLDCLACLRNNMETWITYQVVTTYVVCNYCA